MFPLCLLHLPFCAILTEGTLLGKGCEKMKQIGPGILEKSEIYFSSPSQKAKKLYYNVLCAGHFYCDEKYHLIRENYDSILILHVIEGTFTFRNQEGSYVTAKKNDTVIIDCYNPHEYYTSDTLESVWLHLAGVNSQDLCREIINSKDNLIRCKNSDYVKKLMLEILKGIQTDYLIAETELSLHVYKLLLELLRPNLPKEKNENIHEENIQKVQDYITLHLNEKITVERLAAEIHMSTTHFSRVFKQQTGFSPYDYVLTARLNKAKEFLLKTDLSVAEIAYEAGFNSEANFVYFFTGNEGMSPGKFRKLKF